MRVRGTAGSQLPRNRAWEWSGSTHTPSPRAFCATSWPLQDGVGTGQCFVVPGWPLERALCSPPSASQGPCPDTGQSQGLASLQASLKDGGQMKACVSDGGCGPAGGTWLISRNKSWATWGEGDVVFNRSLLQSRRAFVEGRGRGGQVCPCDS